MAVTRREFLIGAATATFTSGRHYRLIDRIVRPGAPQVAPTGALGLPGEQHLFVGLPTVTDSGTLVTVPPLHHAVVTASLNGPATTADLQRAQQVLESAIAGLEDSGLLDFTPSGLGLAIAWGPPYFDRLPTALTSAWLPIDIAASRANQRTTLAIQNAITFASDPGDTILEQNDVAFVFASDRLDHIASAFDAIFNGPPSDLMTITSIRRGFVDGRHVGSNRQSLTKRMAMNAQIPAAAAIPDSAELFLGFTSTQQAALGQSVIANSDSACTAEVGTANQEPITTAGTLPPSNHVSLSGLGTYYWQATYGGDGSNAPSSSPCGSETEVVISGTSTTSLTKPAEYTIPEGKSDTDLVTVTGHVANGAPTGTVTFTLCGPLAMSVPPTPCNAPIDEQSNPVPLVAGGGTTSKAASPAFTPPSPGWWCFDNSYSGDANYYSSSDNNSKECINVIPLPGEVDYAGFAVTESPTPAAPAASSTSSAATTFTVPSVACTSESSGIVIGSGIFSSVSGWVSAGGIVVACQGGAPVYTAQAVVNNDVTNLALIPAPGDTVSTAVDIVPGSTKVTVDDVTQDLSSTTSEAAGSVGTYLSDGIDADRGPDVLPVPNFGGITFSNSSINGVNLRDAGAVAVSRVSASGVLEIYTAPLNADGDGFGQTSVPVGTFTPTVSTTPTSSSIVVGNSDTDTATVTGNATSGSPTGTLSFYECGPTTTPKPCASRSNPVGDRW